jgi:hypothetical protein
VPGTVLFVVVAVFGVFFFLAIGEALPIGFGDAEPIMLPVFGFVLPPEAAPCVVSELPVGLFTVVDVPLFGLGELCAKAAVLTPSASATTDAAGMNVFMFKIPRQRLYVEAAIFKPARIGRMR